MIIHPSQIPVAHRLYSPTPEEVAYAGKIVRFFEEEGLAKGWPRYHWTARWWIPPFISTRRTFWVPIRRFRQRRPGNRAEAHIKLLAAYTWTQPCKEVEI
jgi:hypothetical protein